MEFRGTTICAVKKDGVTAIAGDGQVTMGESVVFKNTAIKVRRIYGGKVILGFAGSVTDAFSLSERFEGMLTKFAANRGDRRHRQRRKLRARGGARPGAEHGRFGGVDRAEVLENRKRNLRVHERPYYLRNGVKERSDYGVIPQTNRKRTE